MKLYAQKLLMTDYETGAGKEGRENMTWAGVVKKWLDQWIIGSG
jgi:hypothetical protein